MAGRDESAVTSTAGSFVPGSPTRASSSVTPKRAALPEPVGWRRVGLLSLTFVVVGLVVAVLLTMLFGPPWQVSSEAMAPTLPAGTVVRVRPVSALARGDVVVFPVPAGWRVTGQPEPNALDRVRDLLPGVPGGPLLVSRVVGMPGDEVRCCGPSGELIVNGQVMPTPDQSRRSTDDFRVVVPSGMVFVAGDSRASSLDSRCYLVQLGVGAFVPISSIAGTVAAMWGLSLPEDTVRTAYHGASPGVTPPARAVIEAAKDPQC